MPSCVLSGWVPPSRRGSVSLRSLIRRLAASKVMVRRLVWDMNDAGFGDAVYTLTLGSHDYSLVAFSCPLSDDLRSDRVIAEAWDTSFVLFDGIPDAAEIDRLRRNAPRQEAGGSALVTRAEPGQQISTLL